MDSKQASPALLMIGNAAGNQQVAKLCSETGCRLITADNQQSAVQALESQEFNLVVTNLAISCREYVGVIRTLQKCRPGQPIIVVGTYGTAEEVLAVLREGALDYLPRPLDYDTLERTVGRYLSDQENSTEPSRQWQFESSLQVVYEFTSKQLSQNPFELSVLEHLSARGLISPEAKLQIVLAFQEALANSLEHGNLELKSEWKEIYDPEGVDAYSLRKKERLADPDYSERKIWVAISFDQHELKFVLTDSGKGFTPKAKAVVENDTSGPLVHGRGLSIIDHVMDVMEYSSGGRVLTMIKKLSKL